MTTMLGGSGAGSGREDGGGTTGERKGGGGVKSILSSLAELEARKSLKVGA